VSLRKKLQAPLQKTSVIAREARPKQSLNETLRIKDCFASLAMTHECRDDAGVTFLLLPVLIQKILHPVFGMLQYKFFEPGLHIKKRCIRSVNIILLI
jgi:hypothetical protein